MALMFSPHFIRTFSLSRHCNISPDLSGQHATYALCQQAYYFPFHAHVHAPTHLSIPIEGMRSPLHNFAWLQEDSVLTMNTQEDPAEATASEAQGERTKCFDRYAFLLHFLCFTPMEQESLVQQHGIKSFDDLLAKMKELEKAKFRGIDRERQVKLHLCLLWYQDYVRMYEKEPANWVDDLTKDTLMDFQVNDKRIPFAQGESLRHVFQVLYSNNNELQFRLADLGIRTFDDVFRHRKDLEQGIFGKDRNATHRGGGMVDVLVDIQKKLAQVADWFDAFNEEHGRAPNIQHDLEENVFSEFVAKRHWRYNLNVEQYYLLVKHNIHDAERVSDVVKTCPETERLHVGQKIIDHAVQRIKETQLSPKLRERLPKHADRFIGYWVEKLINLHAAETCRIPYVNSGSTQSGKSAIKAMVLGICRELSIPVILVTKGVPESRELLLKLQDFAGESDQHLVVGREALRKYSANKAELKLAMEGGGAVVVADTTAQLEKVVAAINEHCQKKKFVAIVDEGTLKRSTPHKAFILVDANDNILQPIQCTAHTISPKGLKSTMINSCRRRISACASL